MPCIEAFLNEMVVVTWLVPCSTDTKSVAMANHSAPCRKHAALRQCADGHNTPTSILNPLQPIKICSRQCYNGCEWNARYHVFVGQSKKIPV